MGQYQPSFSAEPLIISSPSGLMKLKEVKAAAACIDIESGHM